MYLHKLLASSLAQTSVEHLENSIRYILKGTVNESLYFSTVILLRFSMLFIVQNDERIVFLYFKTEPVIR